MLDSLSSYTNLASPMASIFQKFFTTPDYAITVPFDINRLSYFSFLKAKTLRRTKARWCWFDSASKDDQVAGTRLGTLRCLPYEIRQQIFQIVLDGYFDEVVESWRRNCSSFHPGNGDYDYSVDRSVLQIRLKGLHCSCGEDKVPIVFDLNSYFSVCNATARPPMGLRLASPSIRREFDDVFLSRRTFRFFCPFTLHRFLDRLSPFQQRQLKHLHLTMFERWACISANSDALTRRDQWMAACQRFPPSLKSVEMRTPFSLEETPALWTKRSTGWYTDQDKDKVNKVTLELLETLYNRISRASPRAVISWTDSEELGKEDYAVLNAGLAELEPWSEELCAYMDSTERTT